MDTIPLSGVGLCSVKAVVFVECWRPRVAGRSCPGAGNPRSTNRHINPNPTCPLPPGTLRSNLDPWGSFEDGRLWEVLKAVQLGQAVAALGGLDARMQEAGDNLRWGVGGLG